MATLQPSEEILAWAKGQPGWRQDALRRLLTKPFAKADEDECLQLLKAAHDVVKSTLSVDPLDKKHLPIRSSSATNLRLVELDAMAGKRGLVQRPIFKAKGNKGYRWVHAFRASSVA